MKNQLCAFFTALQFLFKIVLTDYVMYVIIILISN